MSKKLFIGPESIRNRSTRAIRNEMNVEFRNSLREEVRKHSKIKWTWLRKFAQRTSVDPFNSQFNIALGLLLTMLLFAIPILGFGSLLAMFVGYSLIICGESGVPTGALSVPIGDLVRVVFTALTLVLSFLLFFGGPLRNTHLCSLRYPRIDDSLHNYIRSRTRLSIAVIFVVSIVGYFFASRFQLVPENIFYGIAYSVTQSLFCVSLVLILTRKYVPSITSSILVFGAAAPLVLMIHIPFTVGFEGAFFGYPEVLENQDLMLVKHWCAMFCNPPSWPAFAFSPDQQVNIWTASLLWLLNAGVIFAGVRSYQQLVRSVPSECLDEDDHQCEDILKFSVASNLDDDEAVQEFEIVGGNREELVLARIDELNREPENEMERFLSGMLPRYAWMMRPGKTDWKKEAKKFYAGLRWNMDQADSWANVLGILKNWCVVLVALMATCALVVGWVAACFCQEDLANGWLCARATCFAIMLIPVLGVVVCLSDACMGSDRFPVDLQKQFNATPKMWAQNVAYVLPIFVLLVSIYGWFFSIQIWDFVALALQPIICSYALVWLATSFRYCTFHASTLGNWWCGFLLIVLAFSVFCVACMLPDSMRSAAYTSGLGSAMKIWTLYSDELGVGLFVGICAAMRMSARSWQNYGDISLNLRAIFNKRQHQQRVEANPVLFN